MPSTSYNSYHAGRERDTVIILKSGKTEARKPLVVCSLAVNDGTRTEHFYKKYTLTGLNKSSVHRVHSDVSPPPSQPYTTPQRPPRTRSFSGISLSYSSMYVSHSGAASLSTNQSINVTMFYRLRCILLLPLTKRSRKLEPGFEPGWYAKVHAFNHYAKLLKSKEI